MASLKRDTPAGRAALARRRQRAEVVVKHSSRFVNPEEDGVIGATSTTDSNQSQSPPQEDEQDQYVHIRSPPPSIRRAQADSPTRRQLQHSQQKDKVTPGDPPVKALAAATSTAKAAASALYSVANLPSSDELLERSSQVAQAAASILASARKKKQPQRTNVYENKSNSHSMETPNSNSFGNSSDMTSNSAATAVTSSARYKDRPNTSSSAAINSTASKSTVPAAQAAFNQGHLQGQSGLNYQSPMEALQRIERMAIDETTAISTTTPSTFSTTLDNRVGFQSLPLSGDYENEFQHDYTPTHILSRASDDEDDVTTEELEPVLSTQGEVEILDAACAESGSSIMLLSMATSATVMIPTISSGPINSTVMLDLQQPAESAAFVGGNGLGLGVETFHMHKVETHGAISEDRPLRWGDSVAILSPHAPDPSNVGDFKALGIRRVCINQDHGNMQANYQIGWFRSSLGQGETWTILRGKDCSLNGVRVGLSAPRAARVLAERRAARAECTRVVQSGDPVLLRHNQTGGILSVNMGDGYLELVSDSYDSNRNIGPSRAGSNKSLLVQLQRHDRYIPTDQNTFAFIKSSVPPCPRWILGGGTSSSCNQTNNPHGHRIYLHQSYLLEPKRHDAPTELRAKLFGSQWSTLSMSLDENGRPVQEMNLREQETLLIDEVIGACCGLEGKHIVAKVIDQDDSGPSTQSIAKPQMTEFALREVSAVLFDASLRNLVEKILPLSTSYIHVSAFVASHFPGYEYGSVMQAFCEALDELLQQYALFVADLEVTFRRLNAGDTALTLRRLHALLLSSVHSMSLLERASATVQDKTGGALINALATLKAWTCEGDLVTSNILSILIEKASR